jgi:C-terminal processing protease CtpA/Prc
MTAGEHNHLLIVDTSGMNPLGKKIGYQIGDLIYSINGVEINAGNYSVVKNEIGDKIKEGDPMEIKVGRKNASGNLDTVSLKTVYLPMPAAVPGKLELMPDPTPEQMAVRNSWLVLKN